MVATFFLNPNDSQYVTVDSYTDEEPDSKVTIMKNRFLVFAAFSYGFDGMASLLTHFSILVLALINFVCSVVKKEM